MGKITHDILVLAGISSIPFTLLTMLTVIVGCVFLKLLKHLTWSNALRTQRPRLNLQALMTRESPGRSQPQNAPERKCHCPLEGLTCQGKLQPFCQASGFIYNGKVVDHTGGCGKVSQRSKIHTYSLCVSMKAIEQRDASFPATACIDLFFTSSSYATNGLTHNEAKGKDQSKAQAVSFGPCDSPARFPTSSIDLY